MNPKRNFGIVVAIDGPAGTGKSTVTKRLAKELGIVHVDTGALYRAIGLAGVQKQILSESFIQSHHSDRGLSEQMQLEITQIARDAHLEFQSNPKEEPSNRVLLNGEDVTLAIRAPLMGLAASLVGSIGGVRAALLGIQRHLGRLHDSVLEGRDIGTVIFPDADVKIFLTASLEERASRRVEELRSQGAQVDAKEIADQLAQRDEADENRRVAPLKRAKDAVEIDTTARSVDEVVSEIAQKVRLVMAEKAKS